MTAICSSHYRNPLNDYVGKKHHHKNRFRQRQSSRSAFYQPGLRVIESRESINCDNNSESNSDSSNDTNSDGNAYFRMKTSGQQQQQVQQPLHNSITNTETNANANTITETETETGFWGFRPSAIQYEEYGKGEMRVSDIVDCYVRDNERAQREGVLIPPRPTLARKNHHKHVRDALFSATTHNTINNKNLPKSQESILRVLQWNIQAFLSPKDERNMHTITAGIIRSISESDSDVLILNEIHWREMDNYFLNHHNHNHNHNQNHPVLCLSDTQQAIRSSQALLEEVLKLRGYHFIRIAKHGDTPTMIATRKKVLTCKEIILSNNRSALCLLVETEITSSTSSIGKFWVVGTHLDAFEAEHRRKEISKLLQDDEMKCQSPCQSQCQHQHHCTSSFPIVIAGDFNQQRATDYSDSEWKNISASADLRGVPLDDGVANLLKNNGFTCILDHVRNQNNNNNVRCNWDQNQPPPSTHWSGTVIDYTYYANPHPPPALVSPATTSTTSTSTSAIATPSSTTTIAPQGVYIGPAGFSDHRMTVTDWILTTTTPPQEATNKKDPKTNRGHEMDKNHNKKNNNKIFFFHHLPAGRHRSWLYSYKNRRQFLANPTRRQTRK